MAYYYESYTCYNLWGNLTLFNKVPTREYIDRTRLDKDNRRNFDIDHMNRLWKQHKFKDVFFKTQKTSMGDYYNSDTFHNLWENINLFNKEPSRE